MIQNYSIKMFFLSSLLLSTPALATENDFDSVCQYFKQLAGLSDVDSMTNIQRNEIILSNISKGLSESSNARVAWIAIDSAIPEQRYELFQSAAESVLNSRWECEYMKRWALKTGEF